MKLFAYGLFACGTLLSCGVFTGCSSPTGDPSFLSDQQSPAAVAPTSAANVARFRVGDTVTISFSGPPNPIADHVEAIKEDGNITLDLIGKIHALGKTPGELQNEIQADYVPVFYRRLTVTVTSSIDRVYYVGGEVMTPGPKEYLGETTVTKAIQSAGDFNPYASHKVWLNRANGERVQVDCDKALKDSSLDPQVYPGDQIVVKRSFF